MEEAESAAWDGAETRSHTPDQFLSPWAQSGRCLSSKKKPGPQAHRKNSTTPVGHSCVCAKDIIKKQEVLGHLWIRTAAATPQHHMSVNFLVALLFAYACAQPPCKPLPAGCKDYKVVAGDACYRIAGKTETTFDYLFKKVGSCGVPCDANLNVGDVLAACPTPNYPPKECSWYKVKGGDSCTTIATAYNSHNITEGSKSQSAKERTVEPPSLLEGNGLRTAHIRWGNH